MNKKQNGNTRMKSKRMPKQQTSRERLERDFAISGFYITREHLETLGFDTANVDDAKMEEVASRLGDIMDWKEDDAIQAADECGIPKHPEKPTA